MYSFHLSSFFSAQDNVFDLIPWKNLKRTLNNMESVSYLPPSISVHTFSDKVMDTDIYFQVVKLTDSFYLWIGKSNNFGDLSVAMATISKTISATNLCGGSESHSVVLAERLCKKTGKQVFVGGDMQKFDQILYPLLEKRIIEEMQTNPEKF